MEASREQPTTEQFLQTAPLTQTWTVVCGFSSTWAVRLQQTVSKLRSIIASNHSEWILISEPVSQAAARQQVLGSPPCKGASEKPPGGARSGAGSVSDLLWGSRSGSCTFASLLDSLRVSGSSPGPVGPRRSGAARWDQVSLTRITLSPLKRPKLVPSRSCCRKEGACESGVSDSDAPDSVHKSDRFKCCRLSLSFYTGKKKVNMCQKRDKSVCDPAPTVNETVVLCVGSAGWIHTDVKQIAAEAV